MLNPLGGPPMTDEELEMEVNSDTLFSSDEPDSRVTKHLPGQHDQKDHGNRGGSTHDQAVERMANSITAMASMSDAELAADASRILTTRVARQGDGYFSSLSGAVHSFIQSPSQIIEQRVRQIEAGTAPKLDASTSSARTLMHAVDHSPPTTVPLYRGVRLDADELAAAFDHESVTPGKEFDIDMASFTDQQKIGERFALGLPGSTKSREYESPGRTGMLFRLRSGAHAMFVQPLKIQFRGIDDEREWVTRGHFRVSYTHWVTHSGSFKPYGKSNPVSYLERMLVVDIEQVNR